MWRAGVSRATDRLSRSALPLAVHAASGDGWAGGSSWRASDWPAPAKAAGQVPVSMPPAASRYPTVYRNTSGAEGVREDALDGVCCQHAARRCPGLQLALQPPCSRAAPSHRQKRARSHHRQARLSAPTPPSPSDAASRALRGLRAVSERARRLLWAQSRLSLGLSPSPSLRLSLHSSDAISRAHTHTLSLCVRLSFFSLRSFIAWPLAAALYRDCNCPVHSFGTRLDRSSLEVIFGTVTQVIPCP
ncbi:hypothetical protein M432DRAFT_587407 [Thermoascus aurantiacus ATCC 26904]